MQGYAPFPFVSSSFANVFLFFFFFLFPTTEIITTTSHRLGTIEYRDPFLLLARVSSLSLFLSLFRADEYISRQKRVAGAFNDSASS